MIDVKLTLNTHEDSAAVAVKAAVERKKAAIQEPIEDAWQRILAMNNSDPDKEKLRTVRTAMAEGLIGRDPSLAAKRFSKAEALRMWAELNKRNRAATLRAMVEATPAHYVLVRDERTLTQMYDVIAAADIIAVDCETFGTPDNPDGALDPWTGNMAGFSVSTREHSFYVPLNHDERTELNEATVLQRLKAVLETTPSVMHNAPFDCKWFAVKYGINLIDALHADTRLMAMAFDENRSHRLKDLCTDWLGLPGDNFDVLFGRTPFNQVPLDIALAYAAGDTEKTLKLFDWIRGHYSRREDLARIERLVFDVEMPVMRQFIRSDIRGIRFDTQMANELDAKFEREEAELQAKIYTLLGEEINLNSPAQLSRKLYGELKLTDVDKGSTGVRALKRIKREHEVIPLILDYRAVGKLRQAFTSKLPHNVKADGKIHPWHNTWGAATGRFTCNTPNTQQIPAKRPEIRHLFTSTGPDRILVSIDYSQIELRVLAHMADERVLIEAFEAGRDIHSTTAALISNGQFTYEDIERYKDTEGHAAQKYRKQAKIVNFGIVYGMGAGKLADTLEITKAEAQKIIDDYFRGYPGIKRYMDEQHAKVMRDGYVTDLLGRKRRLHAEIKAKEKWRVFSAQRMGGNFPIQSGAGGILKKALVDLDAVMPLYDTYILLQVHDELVFDCPRDITPAAIDHIRSTMEQAVKLRCPVRCDVEINPERWLKKVDVDAWFSEEDTD
ncbi:DNA polymerase-1 [Paenibacillus sp. BK033]|uniref:DNA polymerase n=1 Tax=Paenibacillus sp. BK033 TaxID=2512133 RepID=UPI00104BB12F|nr:DNA polymerase [Paenibacillus sp. BK033]TCM89643.1 DNA polymerase-1 [Paenibacillus sp. BK033]